MTNFEDAAEIIKSRHKGSQVMVARIDSDDLISNDYLACVEKAIKGAARKKPVQFCVSAAGYVNDFRWIQKLDYPSSPFVTIYYDSFDHKIDFGRHTDILQKGPVSCDAHIWAQVVHASNLYNCFMMDKTRRVRPRYWPQNFLDLQSFDDMSRRVIERVRNQPMRHKFYLARLSVPGGVSVTRAAYKIKQRFFPEEPRP